MTRRWFNGSNSVSHEIHNDPAHPIPAGVGTTNEAKFYYDTQLPPASPMPSPSPGTSVGRLVAQTYGTGTNGDYYAYDSLGRPTLKIQQTGTKNYPIQATYTLSGAISSLTYPSGHSVTNFYDQAGRLTSFSGNLGEGGSPRTYSSGILYSPTGGLVKEQFGTTTSIYNKLFYNSRGQLAEIRASTSYNGPTDYTADRGAIVNNYSNNCTGICSGLSMPDNNGNLKKQEIHIPSQTMRWQEYSYDSLNRLKSAREVLNGGAEQWKQTFTYDRWGNRTIDTDPANTYGIGINNKAFTVNTVNNRLGVPVGQPGVMTYDNAGNLTNDTYTGAGNRTYDSENKITSAWGGNNQAQLYSYDAAGQGIKRTVDGVETWQVYGLGGELLAEYPANGASASPQKEYSYRNGQLLVTAEAASGPSPQNVAWTNAVGVSVSGNNLTRTAAGNSWNAAGAVSSQTIASGDGYVEITATETNKKRAFGLTNNTSVTYYPHNAYGMHLDESGQISIHEGNGVYGVFGTYTTGDVLRVAIEGGVVKYRKNGTLLRTSTVAPTYPLRAGAALYTNGSTVNGAVLSTGADSSPSQLRWLVSDHLGTPRMIFDMSGALANMKRHDYLPFGEELFAPTGGRTAAMGYAGGDGVRQQFTQKERDNETGLDYFGARYYSSTQGRFTSPDDFFKDTDVGDPQSWNKYEFVRNNPLKYVDPTGEKATVTIKTDEDKKTGTITISASIAIYAQGISQAQLDDARDAVESAIMSAWNGTFEHEGITYSVTTCVLVQAYSNKDDAMGSGYDNVIGISAGDARLGIPSQVDQRGLKGDSVPDTGIWKFDRIMNGRAAAHEFIHLLGASDTRDNSMVSYSAGPFQTPVDKYGKANALDYRHTLGAAVAGHRRKSQPWELDPNREIGKGPQYRRGRERSRTSTTILRAPRIWSW